MRRRCFVAACMTLAAAAWLALGGATGIAQPQLPEPPKGFQPPPPAPPKPYTQVTFSPPAPFDDASFVAFRKNLGQIAQRKDRAALGRLIVTKDFFWVQQDNDIADKRKPGIDNLARAIGLDAQGGNGWDVLNDAASDPTAQELPQQQGLYCAPALPGFDGNALEALLQQTETDPTDWGYPSSNGVEVHGAAAPNAPVTEKLGMYFVRVLADTAPPDNSQGSAFLHIALPDGKAGFIPFSALVPLVNDQICYAKEASNWKIAGYIGGLPQQ